MLGPPSYLTPGVACATGSSTQPSQAPTSDEQEETALVGGAPLKREGLSRDLIKWVVLALLVVQNSGSYLLMRHTRSGAITGPKYLPSVVILFGEIGKLWMCLAVMLVSRLRQNGGPLAPPRSIGDPRWVGWKSVLTLTIPAACYTVQNNLVLFAAQHMSAVALQITCQTKVLSTAAFTVLMLQRSFLAVQWLSFALLAIGVVLVQHDESNVSSSTSYSVLGTIAALTASFVSGFAGVYLEIMFNHGDTSIWMRNVQLGSMMLPLQALAVIDECAAHGVHGNGLLRGFHTSTWLLVGSHAVGGVIVSAVIKYAGNVMKGFASAVAILCTCLLSPLVMRSPSHPTPLTGVGVAAVLLSMHLYSNACRVRRCDGDPP